MKFGLSLPGIERSGAPRPRPTRPAVLAEVRVSLCGRTMDLHSDPISGSRCVASGGHCQRTVPRGPIAVASRQGAAYFAGPRRPGWPARRGAQAAALCAQEMCEPTRPRTLSSGGRTGRGASAAGFNPGFLTGGRDDVLGQADALPGPLRIPDRGYAERSGRSESRPDQHLSSIALTARQRASS